MNDLSPKEREQIIAALKSRIEMLESVIENTIQRIESGSDSYQTDLSNREFAWAVKLQETTCRNALSILAQP